MHIAVCDDDKEQLARISLSLDQYKTKRGVTITYKLFHSPVELLSTIKMGDYGLYFLDVIMPVMNGIEVAKEIRDFDTEAKIVFFTSSPEFAVDSYTVKALDYILKPIDEKRLFNVLDEFIIDIQKPLEGFNVKTKNGIMRILFSKLAYVEVINKRVYFHLLDSVVREAVASLSEFQEILLARPEFVRVHRSYIVNLYQINELSLGGIITHQGENIPVSRTLYKQVRNAYVEQLFVEEGID